MEFHNSDALQWNAPIRPAAIQSKLMYAKAEAAKMLSLSVRTIENLIANKQLTARKVGKRVLISHQSLMEFTRRDHATSRIQ